MFLYGEVVVELGFSKKELKDEEQCMV